MLKISIARGMEESLWSPRTRYSQSGTIIQVKIQGHSEDRHYKETGRMNQTIIKLCTLCFVLVYLEAI